MDSAFYLYVNGVKKGYSQISHATSEFDITDLVVDGENTLDVLVLKWCVSTYLECQDKFRFSGIFRDVYLLTRPDKHITDYTLETKIDGENGILTVRNESPVDILCEIEVQKITVGTGKSASIIVDPITPWTAENPKLYTLTLSASGEKIVEKIGFREVTIDGKVFKINGVPVKLRGVNRHEFHPETAATVSLEDMEQDLRLMKELNVNAVRTSHYPDCPEFYLLCDLWGIYVMDEADLETHGACVRQGGYEDALWQEYAEMDFSPPVSPNAMYPWWSGIKIAPPLLSGPWATKVPSAVPSRTAPNTFEAGMPPVRSIMRDCSTRIPSIITQIWWIWSA